MLEGSWRSRAPELVIGASIGATLFTKATGIIGVLLLLAVHAARGRSAPAEPAAAGSIIRRALLIGALAVLPFIVEQGYTEARIASRHFNPYEVNLSVRQTPALLANDAQVTYRGGGLLARPGLVQLRLWNSYDIPATLRLVYTIFLLGLLVFSATTWFGRATLPLLSAYIVIWLLWPVSLAMLRRQRLAWQVSIVAATTLVGTTTG